MNDFINSLQAQLGGTLVNLAAALLVLLVGWIVALVLRAAVRRGLGLLALNARVQSGTGNSIDLERGVSAGAFYLALAFVLVAFFDSLNLDIVSSTLQRLVDEVLAYLPKLAAGGVLLLAAWILAAVLRAVVSRGLAATNFDERLSREAGVRPLSGYLGDVTYWIVLLLFLPAILGALEMGGLLGPVQNLVDSILGAVPKLLGAALIGGVGWFAARVLRDLVANLLGAAGADALGRRAGLAGDTTLSRLVGLVVYAFVLVPALIAALNALSIESISGPATAMLEAFMSAIPHVFAAALILAVAWVAARFVAGIAASFLSGVGFDALPERLGIAGIVPPATTPSALAGRALIFFVMLFATAEAAQQVGMAEVGHQIGRLISFGADVLLGLVIITIGYWLASLARDAVSRAGGEGALGAIVQYSILGIVLAMGLRAMGLADDIVNLAFGLTLGAAAVAFALAFGLGGREAAGRQVESWFEQLRRR